MSEYWIGYFTGLFSVVAGASFADGYIGFGVVCFCCAVGMGFFRKREDDDGD